MAGSFWAVSSKSGAPACTPASARNSLLRHGMVFDKPMEVGYRYEALLDRLVRLAWIERRCSRPSSRPPASVRVPHGSIAITAWTRVVSHRAVLRNGMSSVLITAADPLFARRVFWASPSEVGGRPVDRSHGASVSILGCVQPLHGDRVRASSTRPTQRGDSLCDGSAGSEPASSQPSRPHLDCGARVGGTARRRMVAACAPIDWR